MNAIVVTEHGGPDVLALREQDDPQPRKHEVVVRVHAAGVNYIDTYHRTGAYPGFPPFVPGMEGAGEVAAVGADVTDVAVGDRVAWAGRRGSYAELQAVPAHRVVPVPDELDLDLAAALMLQGMTAHYLTRSAFRLQEGHTCLIHAAAGGTGLLMCQLASRAGARILGTASTEAKAANATEAGADEMILYTERDFKEAVMDLTDGAGVDVVFDSVGQETFMDSLESLKTRGTMVLFGASSGAVDPVDPQVLNHKGSLFLTRPTLMDYIATREELEARSSDLFAWAAAGELDVRVDSRWNLADAADAHRRLESRESSGKLLLTTSAA